ncbi:MAG: hypothetical protein GYA24_11575 [Candidatus Lokiarchaeota archaeon]|nr:hypothetical protein [Candidatus Lokiarchaeota archaeon]
MSIKIPESVQKELATILRSMEETTELTRCVVVTRTGIKIAPDMDADSYSASSAALIDLGERVVASLEHGTLEELVINAIGGYVILAAVGTDYMLLGATSAALKMGYYLPYVRKKAWDLENIIYGAKPASLPDVPAQKIKGLEAPRSPLQQPVSTAGAKPDGKITMSDIKAADMQAMNDVLAAFDEFGINDDFTKSLGNEAVPTVNISQAEMSAINQQKAGQGSIGAEIAPEDVPVATRTTSIPMASATPGSRSSGASGTGAQKARAGDCPIPLEPGEVPPIALSPEELIMTDGVAFTSPAAPLEVAAPVTVEAPVPAIATPVPVAREAPPAAPRTTSPAVSTPATPPGTAPSFDTASEYDFDFDGSVKQEKDVVVPEQDSMSDTLKALGWEEEDEK